MTGGAVIVGFFSGINRSAAEANAFLKERNHTSSPSCIQTRHFQFFGFFFGLVWRFKNISSSDASITDPTFGSVRKGIHIAPLFFYLFL
jgi:hypothetical protein